MTYLKNRKEKIFSIALVFTLALSALLAIIPIAHAARTYKTYSYITAFPSPVGVGETVFVSAWLDRYPPSNSSARYAPYVPWTFVVTITDPSGQIQTKTLQSDPIGGATFTFTASALGTWTLKMHFQGAGPIPQDNNNTYTPSDSNVFSLVVQQDPIKPWPPAPLPTGYWTRPIDAQNREWWAISGSWSGMAPLGSPGNINAYDSLGKFNPYTTAPNSPHVVWTKPIEFGGLAGGKYGSIGFYSGDSYELKSSGFILAGVYYRNMPKTNTATGNGFIGVDLRTGKELWHTPNGTISYGQLLQYDSQNQHGVIPYLWSTSLDVYDANTGLWLMNLANSPGGSMFQDEKGNILSYILSQTQHRISLWNSTRAIEYGKPSGPGTGMSGIDYWRPAYGVASDARAGIMWNNTIPAVEGNPSIIKIDPVDRVILARGTIAANDTYPDGVEVDAGYSMDDGHQIWVKFRTGEDAVLGQQAGFGYNVGPGAYVVQKQETEVFHCFNILTGEKMWTSEPRSSPWGSYYTTIGDNSVQFAYGNVYVTSYDGILQCYEVATGKNIFNSYVGDAGLETPYGTWPLWGSLAVADGKVYAGTNEHSINQPMYRGERLYCFDAYTGEMIWKVFGIDMNPMIADGYLVVFNSYDMQNYCFGKGLSATTVEGPLTAVPQGASMVIQGTITDQSSGQTCLGVPAAGTPAIADASMGQWMEYLYMQKPKPTNATGVPVTLVAIASDGTSETIGSTTSDVSGTFAISWTPSTKGLYTIVANFDGTDSYYSSWAETHVAVGDPTSTAPSANDVANQVVSQLPTPAPYPTSASASDVANQVISKMPLQVDNTMLITLVLAVGVIVAILVAVNIVVSLRKQQK